MQFSGSLNIFFGIALLCDLKWKRTFSSSVATAEYSKFADILELLVIPLHSSPVFYWILSNLGGSSSGVIFFFDFLYCPWGSSKKNTGVGCHLLLHWTMFCQNSSGTAKALLERLWPVCLECPCMAWLMAHSFIELCKPLHHDKVVFHEREDNA